MEVDCYLSKRLIKRINVIDREISRQTAAWGCSEDSGVPSSTVQRKEGGSMSHG